MSRQPHWVTSGQDVKEEAVNEKSSPDRKLTGQKEVSLDKSSQSHGKNGKVNKSLAQSKCSAIANVSFTFWLTSLLLCIITVCLLL